MARPGYPKEKANASAAKYRKKHRDKILIRLRNCALKRNYGIDLEEYNKMFQERQGCCDCCGRHQSETEQALGVDHVHGSSPIKIRGLLCWECNTAIGKLGDNIEGVMNAVRYLENSQ